MSLNRVKLTRMDRYEVNGLCRRPSIDFDHSHFSTCLEGREDHVVFASALRLDLFVGTSRHGDPPTGSFQVWRD